jgi:hypothetical protein
MNYCMSALRARLTLTHLAFRSHALLLLRQPRNRRPPPQPSDSQSPSEAAKRNAQRPLLDAWLRSEQ